MQAMELFRDILGLTDENLVQDLAALATSIALKKGEFLYREGEPADKISFLSHGLLRGYFLDTNGRDITDCFVFGYGTPVMASIDPREPTVVNMEALTDCAMLQLPIAPIMELVEEHAQVCRLYTHFLLQSLKRHWEVKSAMYQYDATQRYQWFLSAYPGLHQQVSGKHIASFLGMTQVTLSRLRRSLRENGQL